MGGTMTGDRETDETPVTWVMHHTYPGVPESVRSPSALVMGYALHGRWTAMSQPGPVVHVSGQLLNELHQGCPEFVEFTCIYPADGALGSGTKHLHIGATIRISGDDCKMVYVVCERILADPEVWKATWPD